MEKLLLARDPAYVAIIDVVEAARHQHSGKPISRALAIPGISQLVAQVDAARRSSVAGRTLRDLLQAAPAPLFNPATGQTGEFELPPTDAATRQLSSDRQ